MPSKRTPWVQIRRASNPDEIIALPAEEYENPLARLSPKHYIIYNTVTKAAQLKERGQPTILLGHHDTLNLAIQKAMKL